jgi:cerevisin
MPYLPEFDTFSSPEAAADVTSNEDMDVTASAASHMATERGAPWGLARISHRNSLTLSTFQKYEYVEEGGEGVDAYVIDTGEQFPSCIDAGRRRRFSSS